MLNSGLQEGLELPEDEEEKKKTEADKEKFSGLCKVYLIGLYGSSATYLCCPSGDEGHPGQED